MHRVCKAINGKTARYYTSVLNLSSEQDSPKVCILDFYSSEFVSTHGYVTLPQEV